MSATKRKTARPKTWADVSAKIRANVHERLRGQMLAAVDQAERFRDPASKHANEAVASTWDATAEDCRLALAVLVDAAKEPTK